MVSSRSRSTCVARPTHALVTERTLYLAAHPETAYLITRDRTVPGDEPFVELAARRGGLPGGHAVAVTVDEQLLRDEGAGRYRIAREHLGSEAIGRAYQPWHVDVEPDVRQRWGGYMQPSMSLTLRNLVGADTPATLTRLEAPRVEARLTELRRRPPQPTLNLAHVRELHRRLFQDVYPWAGEPRTVNIGRPGGPAFQAWDHIDESWQSIENYVGERDQLVGADRSTFVDEAATIYNAVNTTHTFREGNGRTQREWMNALAAGASYQLRWEDVHGRVNDAASQAAREGDLTPLKQMLGAITIHASRADTPRAQLGPKAERSWTTEEELARNRASAGFTRSTIDGVEAAASSGRTGAGPEGRRHSAERPPAREESTTYGYGD